MSFPVEEEWVRLKCTLIPISNSCREHMVKDRSRSIASHLKTKWVLFAQRQHAWGEKTTSRLVNKPGHKTRGAPLIRLGCCAPRLEPRQGSCIQVGCDTRFSDGLSSFNSTRWYATGNSKEGMHFIGATHSQPTQLLSSSIPNTPISIAPNVTQLLLTPEVQ
jgi:hypothetical protein